MKTRILHKAKVKILTWFGRALDISSREEGPGGILSNFTEFKKRTMTTHKIQIRNVWRWFVDQTRHPITLFNRKSWGVFSEYAHIRRSDRQPKKSSETKQEAQSVANFMATKYGGSYSIYKCVYCDGWHVAKDSGKVESEPTVVNEKLREVSPTIDVDMIAKLEIPDFAMVYGGVRGRTMSSVHQSHMWQTIIEAGIRTIIDLREDGIFTRLKGRCEKYGAEYFYFPVDKKATKIKKMVELFPEFCKRIDAGHFYIACAMGLHRTDIALCCYWMFYAADKGIVPPQIRGYRKDEGHDTSKILRVINAFYKAYFEVNGEYPMSYKMFIERKKVIEQQWVATEEKEENYG